MVDDLKPHTSSYLFLLMHYITFHRTDRDLTQRIEFLSRAKINAKSVTSATADSTQSGKLLNDLEEKLGVK